MSNEGEPRFSVDELKRFAAALFRKGGFDDDKSAIVSELLVEADLMGHTTHGLALAPRYLSEIEAGLITAAGEPRVVRDRGACVTWDGRGLPGVWLAAKAVDLGVERARTYGTATIAIGDSRHIACLAVYLERATSKGMVVTIQSSTPSTASVAPFGGMRPVFTPDPIAVGIPTGGEPILVDMSSSITTNNQAMRLAKEGRRFPHQWLLDKDGTPTDDPNAFSSGGSILPAGGLDHGQKGYGLALFVESLTQGLSGFGRVDQPKVTCSSIFVQVIDPEAFAGFGAFTRQTDWIADLCRNTPPRPGVDHVRLPGEAALVRKAAALANGVRLHPGIIEALAGPAAKLGVPVPAPLGA